MAVCQYCKGEMSDEISCRPDALMLDGVTVYPIPWGAEDFSRGRHIDFCCRDCGTPPRGVHHPGCCVERCPGCLGQALGCPCFDDETDDEPDGFGDEVSRPLTRVVRSIRYRPLCRAHRFGRRRLR